MLFVDSKFCDCLSSSLAVESTAKKLNVLMICVDDLKPILGCYGDPIAKTPNLDRLAARGLRFHGAYCNQAVCSPSRNSLMTGLRPQTLGIYDLPTHFRYAAPEAITVAQHFKNHGYETQSLGKIFHVGMVISTIRRLGQFLLGSRKHHFISLRPALHYRPNRRVMVLRGQRRNQPMSAIQSMATGNLLKN